MKKFYITLVASFLACGFCKAQNTPWPSTTSSDNVGIGTASPNAKLTVFQTSPLGTGIKNQILLSTISGLTGSVNANNFQSNTWLVRNTQGNDWYTTRIHQGLAIDGSYQSPQINTRTWWERDPYNNIQSWGNEQATYLTINNGNVGIGTASPNSQLEVKGLSNFDASTILRLTNNAAQYGRTNLVLTGRIQDGNDNWVFGTQARNSIVFSENAAAANQQIGAIGEEKFSIQLEGNSNALGFLSSQNGNSPNMIMFPDGNIAIGTTDSHGYKLAVNGNVRAREIKVEAGPWPDYVFKPTYKLPSLSAVKTYIDQNHHLSEMPSEKEVAKDGINLGEIVKLQTKKIEELTLYLIEQQKENERQNTNIAKLEKALTQKVIVKKKK